MLVDEHKPRRKQTVNGSDFFLHKSRRSAIPLYLIFSCIRKELTFPYTPITECTRVRVNSHSLRRFTGTKYTDMLKQGLVPGDLLTSLAGFPIWILSTSASSEPWSKQQPSSTLCHSASRNICDTHPKLCRCLTRIIGRLVFVIYLLWQALPNTCQFTGFFHLVNSVGSLTSMSISEGIAIP